MAMDRAQLVHIGLPLFLFCADVFNLFSPPPPKPKPVSNLHHSPITTPDVPEFPSIKPAAFGGVGLGHSVTISFCTSCSYKGTAVTMKKMLETAFPGVDVIPANYPPPLPKRVLGKLVPVAQFGFIGIIMGGEQIFPLLGMAPPQWYYSMRANRFGTMAGAWLFGNFVQSYLQSSGAFEVYLDGELVFSKLREGRFPGEIELRDLVGRRLGNSRISDGVGNGWS